MKKLLVALAALLLAVGLAPSAWALGVSADLPVQYALDDAEDVEVTGVSGYKLGLHELISVVGFGYENYTVGFDVDGDTVEGDGEINNTFMDLIVDLPLPVLNLGLGYGVGTGRVQNVEVEGGGQTLEPEFKDADLSQFFVTLGLPIGMFDVHVGYHQITGTAESDDDLADDFEIDGNMTSVGARVGF